MKSTIAEAISMARSKRRALEEDIEIDFPHLGEHQTEILELAKNYESYKRERALLDYDDLLYRLAELLEQYGNGRRRLLESHLYIMIDEYHGTNNLLADLERVHAVPQR